MLKTYAMSNQKKKKKREMKTLREQMKLKFFILYISKTSAQRFSLKLEKYTGCLLVEQNL